MLQSDFELAIVAEPHLWPINRPCRPGKKLYIETVGCQMNLLDSELVVAKLRNEGYELTDDLNQADAILYNTCSVRQHAEDKIYSALGPDQTAQGAQA